MDRLIAEKEVQTQEVKTENLQPSTSKQMKVEEQTSIPVQISSKPQIQTSYLNSLENLTIADIKKEQEDKKVKEFEKEKEVLLEKEYQKIQDEQQERKLAESEQQVSQKTIEKPNYDLIDTKKVVKLKTNKPEKKKKSLKKTAGIALACALGASAIICVTNAVIIDNMSSQFVQLDEQFNLNLATYLKNISKLDTTKQSMEFLETYPDEVLDAGDVGESSNWFDRLCNFIGGLFGG